VPDIRGSIGVHCMGESICGGQKDFILDHSVDQLYLCVQCDIIWLKCKYSKAMLSSFISHCNSTLPIDLVVPPVMKRLCPVHIKTLEDEVCPSISLGLDRIWTELMKKSPDRMSHFFINIGGNDGKTDDPIYDNGYSQ
jgi:hypothetical protein